MFGFSLPEFSGRCHLGDDFAGPQSGGVDVGDGAQRDALLVVIEVEDSRSVAGTAVVALPILGARVVDLKEELQQRPVIGCAWVVNDLERLSMAWMVAVGGSCVLAAGVAHPGRDHPGLAPNQVLHAPEASAGQDRGLGFRHGVLLGCDLGCCEQCPVLAVALRLEVVAVDEPQRSRIDAVAPPAAVPGPVGEHMPQMAVGVRGAHLGTRKQQPEVAFGDDVGDRLGETGPAGTTVELVDRGEQWLARDHIDIDTWRMVVAIPTGERALSAIALRHPVFLGGKRRNRCGIFAVSHTSKLCARPWPSRTYQGMRL